MSKIKHREYLPLALFLAFAVLSFFIVKPLLLAVFIGAVLAYITMPMYNLVSPKFTSKTIPALIICLLVVVILVSAGFFFGKMLIEETYVIFIQVKQKLAVGLFQSCENSFCNMFKELGKNSFISGKVQQSISGLTTWIVNKISNLVISLPQATLNLFVVFFTMFYFLRDSDSIVRKLSNILSMGEKKYQQITGRLRDITKGVLYGYFLVAFIQGLAGGIGFFIFGISSPLFWGIMMGLLALIPYLGTGLVWGPAAVIIFLEGIFQDNNFLIVKGILLFIYGFFVIGMLDNFLKPKIMSTRAKIHPVIIMIGVFGGLIFFGPVGVLVGPLVLSLTMVFIEIYLIKE